MKRILYLPLIAILGVGGSGCVTKRGHVNAGFDAFTDQDFKKAEEEFLAALKDNPNNPYAQLNLAAVYQNTGRADLAVPLYLKVLKTGRKVRPNRKANAKDVENPTLAEMAQANLLRMQEMPDAQPDLNAGTR